MTLRANQPQDVWKRVEPVESGCWLWQGALLSTGYGQMLLAGRQVKVHYIAFAFFGGVVPTGMELDHLCRVRNCVNPAHLEPVTPRTNVLRSQNPAAQNARKTHCPKGHALSGNNMQWVRRADGRRFRKCLACTRESSRQYWVRNGKAKRQARLGVAS